MAEERFDGVFMSVVQQAAGIENFFDALFSFMRRKTDLFTKDDVCRKMVGEVMEKHMKAFAQDKDRQAAIDKKKKEEAMKAEVLKMAQQEQPAFKKTATPVVAESDECMEVTEDEAKQIELEEAAKKAGKPVPAAPEKKAEENKDGDDDKNKGALPNQSNGGNLKAYNWGQSLQEVTVNVYLPTGVTSKMLNVVMTSKKCKVQIKGGETLVEGDWHKQIKVEDSPWCIETDSKGTRILQLNLTKKEGQNWWDSIIEGEEKIDTQKVEPENSKLGDLDNDTRGVVEKMMFDQRQKQQGLPSSDEMEKRNKLDSFMKAHPEMDFSKAKFS